MEKLFRENDEGEVKENDKETDILRPENLAFIFQKILLATVIISGISTRK